MESPSAIYMSLGMLSIASVHLVARAADFGRFDQRAQPESLDENHQDTHAANA